MPGGAPARQLAYAAALVALAGLRRRGHQRASGSRSRSAKSCRSRPDQSHQRHQPHQPMTRTAIGIFAALALTGAIAPGAAHDDAAIGRASRGGLQGQALSRGLRAGPGRPLVRRHRAGRRATARATGPVPRPPHVLHIDVPGAPTDVAERGPRRQAARDRTRDCVAHRGRRHREARRRLRDRGPDRRRMGRHAGGATRGVGVRRAGPAEGAVHAAGAVPLSVHRPPTARRIRGGRAEPEAAVAQAATAKAETFLQKARGAADPIFGLVADDLERVPFVYVRKKPARISTTSLRHRRGVAPAAASRPGSPTAVRDADRHGRNDHAPDCPGSRALHLLADAAAVLQRAAVGRGPDGRLLPDAPADPV